MTTITPTDAICNRCDNNLTDAVQRYMDDGGPPQCPHCSLEFNVSNSYLIENGYDPDPDDGEDDIDEVISNDTTPLVSSVDLKFEKPPGLISRKTVMQFIQSGWK